MPEDTETAVGTTEEIAAPEASEAEDVLAGQGSAPEKTEPSVETEDGTTPPEKTEDDPEVLLELGGKTFTMKQSEAVALLENATKLSEREKALADKEASINKFHTQEGQKNAAFRKSVEKAFGRYPEAMELQALGKIWNQYFKNPQVKQTIDGILSGRINVQNGKTQEQGQESQYVTQLQQEIAELREQLEGFVSSTQEERTTQEQSKAKQTWDSWVAGKAKSNIKITEQVEASMVPFIRAIRDANPEMDSTQVLDEAYEHANIKNLKSTVTGNVLKSADKAKKTPIKITPKQPAKSDQDKSYAAIIKEAAIA